MFWYTQQARYGICDRFLSRSRLCSLCPAFVFFFISINSAIVNDLWNRTSPIFNVNLSSLLSFDISPETGFPLHNQVQAGLAASGPDFHFIAQICCKVIVAAGFLSCPIIWINTELDRIKYALAVSRTHRGEVSCQFQTVLANTDRIVWGFSSASMDRGVWVCMEKPVCFIQDRDIWHIQLQMLRYIRFWSWKREVALCVVKKVRHIVVFACLQCGTECWSPPKSAKAAYSVKKVAQTVICLLKQRWNFLTFAGRKRYREAGPASGMITA